MQAPTGGCRLKASRARVKQWDALMPAIEEFKKNTINFVVLETVMGDFNTDFKNPYDGACKENTFYEAFTDAHQHVNIGTCLVEEQVRDDQIASPTKLRERLIQCDPKFVWSSDTLCEENKPKKGDNGASKFDFIFYRGGELTSDSARVHTTFAQLTDHLTMSAKFKL